MATYIDLDRTSSMSCILAYDAAAKLTDLSYAKPPEYYEWERGADYTISGHFGGSVQVVTSFVTTGSAPVPSPNGTPWYWYINADVTVDNGFGTVVTQTLVLKSGSVPYGTGYVPFKSESQAISGTVSFSYPTRIFYDIDEYVPGDVYLWPPRTKYTQYERTRIGQTATVSITLNGQTVTASGPMGTADGSLYNFSFNGKAFANGASASVENFLLSAPLINSIALPSYSFIFARDANQFVSQTTTINLKSTGTDDAFGGAVDGYAQLTSDVYLERNINFKGWLNAWSGAMNNEKAVEVYGCDVSPIYSPFTGSYDFNYNGYKYGFNAELKLGSSFLLDSNNSDQMPVSNIYAKLVDPYPIFSDPGNDLRMPFRGWHFNGASIYNQKEITLPGTGASRIYAYPNCQNFSAYRFLEVTANSNTASNINSTLDVRYGQLSNTAILQTDLNITPAGNTNRIDLCFADQLHSSYPFPNISYQNNPYPRANPIDTVNESSYKKVNDDMYGISLVGALSLTGDITVSNINLIRDDNTAKCNFIAPYYDYSGGVGYQQLPEVYTTGSTVPENLTVWYYGRRFWQHNTQGKEEEEFDILFIDNQSSIVPSGSGISNFCDRIEATNYLGDKIHPGWIANPSTPISSPSYLRHGYLNSINGYTTWLMGGGMQYADGDQRFGFDRDLSEETNDYDILAQTIFDELNHDFIPDYFDPFKIEAPGETDLKLYSFQSWRGQFHGIVQQQQNGLTVFTREQPSNNFGPNASTDILGNYFTGANYNKIISWKVGVGTTLSSTISDLLGSSTRRVSFYYVPVGQYIISAAMSGFYQHMVGTLTGNTVQLVSTTTPYFTSFQYLTTNITNAAEPAISWVHPTNQNQLAIVVRDRTNNNIKYYTLNDFVNGVSSVATILGTGMTPAIAINGNGTQIVVFRTSSSNIQRVILDAQGNIITSASNVVTGNVKNSGIGCYWRDDVPYIVYDHTSNGITVVKSNDFGITFS